MRAFVTGGAGFIGSHLVDRLLEAGHDVVAFDDFSTGQRLFLERAAESPRFSLFEGTLLDASALVRAMRGADVVFHLAANADVRGGQSDPRRDLTQNVIGTFEVLQAMRANGVRAIAFASSATVYGEPSVFPTPEDTPLHQTSSYGASKLAGEAFLEAFAAYDGLRALVFRFVSFVGERYTHGVVYDFVKKLLANPSELEVLGDGRQRKSYLYVKDGIEAILLAIREAGGGTAGVHTLNLGHDTDLSVLRVADVVCEEMGLSGVGYRMTGGVRGWTGDAPFVFLDTARVKALGWRPTVIIEEGIRRTVRYLLAHPSLLVRP